MSTQLRTGILLAALAAGIGLAGCGGGGGGGSASSALTLGGTAAAGIFINADVKAYDATKATLASPGTPLASGTTGTDGKYSLTLPAGFDKPLMVIVSAKASGSTTQDEIFGTVPMPAGFSLCSVVPSGAYSGASVTGYVTPYTNLMCQIVQNKLGRTDIDAAINQARNVVNQLTGNVDPLNTNPVTDAGMVVRLAAVSNMANESGDPCNAKATPGEKIQCTVEKLAGLVAPMAAGADTGGNVALDVDGAVLGDLSASTGGLNTATVNANTGVNQGDLDAGKGTSGTHLASMSGTTSVTAPSSATATALEQAKAFFASLRAGILPYVDSTGGGFLQTQGEKLMDETYALNMAAIQSVDIMDRVMNWTNNIVYDMEIPRDCTLSGTTYSCSLYVSGTTVTINLSHDAGAKRLSWSVPSTSYTGTIDYTDTSLTVNGLMPGITAGASYAKIGNPGGTDANASPLVMSLSTSGAFTTLNFEGSIKDMKCTGGSCTALTKLAFATGSHIKLEGIPGESAIPVSSSITGTFILPNYRFIGTLTVNSLQMLTTDHGSWIEYEPVGGVGSFTGTINGTGLTGQDSDTGNDFDILVGKLDVSLDSQPKGTWTYNPAMPDSAGNYQKRGLTFTGTVKKSASDPGLKLVVTGGQDWDAAGNDYMDSLSVSYNDYNKGIAVTGSASYLNHTAATRMLVLADANGIKVTFAEGMALLAVHKDSTQVATINSSGRISYVDGTFESLY